MDTNEGPAGPRAQPAPTLAAARALQTQPLIPIHFNRTFEQPDCYGPLADAGDRITRLAAERGANVRFLEPGEWIDAALYARAGERATRPANHHAPAATSAPTSQPASTSVG